MKEYELRFSELKEDTETFEFVLGESFFKVFQSSEWEQGRIKAQVKAQRRPDGITLVISLKGMLDVVCDRCLDVYSHKVNCKEQLFLKFGQKEEEIDANILIVSKDDNKMDLSHIFYEYILLTIPVKKVHPVDGKGVSGCNKEMIEELNKHMIQNESGQTDSRWDDLKKLLDKN